MPGAIRYDPVTDVDIAVGVGGQTVTSPAGGQISANRVNLRTFALTASQTWAPAAVEPHNYQSVDVPLLGARVGYPALATFGGIIGHENHILWAKVVNPEAVRVILSNNDNDSLLTVGSGTLRVFCFPVPLT